MRRGVSTAESLAFERKLTWNRRHIRATYEVVMAEGAEHVRSLAGEAVDDQFDLPDLCARPQCRKEFRQSVGRGRKRDYCSETCRRLADRDYKRAKATVEHFEKLARRSRHDVLAFGRSADELDEEAVSDETVIAQAVAALGRVDAVLRFVGDADPRLVEELEALRDGVRGVVTRAQAG